MIGKKRSVLDNAANPCIYCFLILASVSQDFRDAHFGSSADNKVMQSINFDFLGDVPHTFDCNIYYSCVYAASGRVEPLIRLILLILNVSSLRYSST